MKQMFDERAPFRKEQKFLYLKAQKKSKPKNGRMFYYRKLKGTDVEDHAVRTEKG